MQDEHISSAEPPLDLSPFTLRYGGKVPATHQLLPTGQILHNNFSSPWNELQFYPLVPTRFELLILHIYRPWIPIIGRADNRNLTSDAPAQNFKSDARVLTTWALTLVKKQIHLPLVPVQPFRVNKISWQDAHILNCNTNTLNLYIFNAPCFLRCLTCAAPACMAYCASLGNTGILLGRLMTIS